MVASPTRARTIMAMKPANLPKMMEKRINPRKDTPMAMAAKESASDAHELQRFLYALVYRKEIFHRMLKFGRSQTHGQMVRLPPVSYLKKSGSASDMAMKATQPPMVSMMVFFTSWSPFCILKYTLNAPTSTMTAAMAFIRLETGG